MTDLMKKRAERQSELREAKAAARRQRRAAKQRDETMRDEAPPPAESMKPSAALMASLKSRSLSSEKLHKRKANKPAVNLSKVVKRKRE